MKFIEQAMNDYNIGDKALNDAVAEWRASKEYTCDLHEYLGVELHEYGRLTLNDNLDEVVINHIKNNVKPCPFCGKTPDASSEDWVYPSGRPYLCSETDKEIQLWNVNCVGSEGGCNASTLGNSKREALTNWNRRVK